MDFAVAAPKQSQDTNGGPTKGQATGSKIKCLGERQLQGESAMKFIEIAGAATLTGVGVGCLAAGAALWQRAGVDLALVARTVRAISA